MKKVTIDPNPEYEKDEFGNKFPKEEEQKEVIKEKKKEKINSAERRPDETETNGQNE